MRYTVEQHEFMKKFIPEHTHSEIVEEFNKRFPDTPITCNQSRAYVKNNHIRTANDGRFKKGQAAHNKGKKVSEEIRKKCESTMFRKGHTPHNRVPVGSIVVATVGYNRIKIAEPNKWMMYSRYVWEQNNGPIPEHHKIIHINGDRLDDRIENLDIVKDETISRINATKMFGKNEDVNRCVITMSKLNTMISKKST